MLPQVHELVQAPGVGAPVEAGSPPAPATASQPRRLEANRAAATTPASSKKLLAQRRARPPKKSNKSFFADLPIDGDPPFVPLHTRRRQPSSTWDGVVATERQVLKPALPSVHRFAAAQAVLAPLCDLKQVEFPPRLETVEALRLLWPQRLEELQRAGWKAIVKSSAFAYAYRCPCHAFAADPSGRRPCKNYRVCPFCWALQVEVLFENVLRALDKASRPVDLYLNVRTEFIKARELPRWLGLMKERAYDMSWGLHPPILGSLSRTTVAPTARQKGKTVTLRQATLQAVPAGGSGPGGWGGHTVRVRKQSKMSLAWAVSRLARYPVGLLYEDARSVVAVLDVVSRQHLGSAHGIFRSAASITDVTQIRTHPCAPAIKSGLDWDQLGEEQRIVAHLKPEHPLHERFVTRSVQAKLGLGVVGPESSHMPSADFPIYWHGAFDLAKGFPFAIKGLRKLYGPHRREPVFAVAVLDPTLKDYFVLSTVVELPSEVSCERGSVRTVQCKGKDGNYAIDALGPLIGVLEGSDVASVVRSGSQRGGHPAANNPALGSPGRVLAG